jgi:hypothetical protein
MIEETTSSPVIADPYEQVLRLTEALENDGPDEAVELSLPALRHQAAQQLRDIEDGRATWPPELADPFPDVIGRLPEIAPTEVDADLIGGAVLHHGAVVIRGLLDDQWLERFREDLGHTFQARAEAETPLTPKPPWYVPFRAGGNTVGQKGKTHLVRLVDAPRVLVDVLAAYRALGLLDAMATYFGEPPVITSNKSVLRNLELPDPIPTDFHQDGRFMGAEVRSLNVWVTLDDCGPGGDAPALDLVPRREPVILPTGNGDSGFDWTLSAGEVAVAAGSTPPVRLDLRAGDGLVFDHFLVHRTGYEPEMTKPRRAIECWFFAPSSVPWQYQPLRA